MTFSVEYDEDIRELDLCVEEIFKSVAREALRYTDCPFECEISLTLTNDVAIRMLNKEYRKTDKATDVLSFPLQEFEKAGDFSGISEDSADCFNPDTGELMLGDIVISTDHVIAQAASYGHSVKREFAFLIAHSMLHLQGFDHMEPDDAIIMEKAQDKILDKLGIRR
ncbi:MAG: rRNA maturation RNase YbeY [Lachnospiraceae bacterium]|nr:rRNA maturation RNase YbeY [Lachnospiraceae bacterium]